MTTTEIKQENLLLKEAITKLIEDYKVKTGYYPTVDIKVVAVETTSGTFRYPPEVSVTTIIE